MIKFYKNTTTTHVDIKGKTSLMFYSINGCNLKCYKCHSYKDLIETKHAIIISESDCINIIKNNGFLYDAIVFSGGEFLINNIDFIKSFLYNVRKEYDGLIIINTNGTFPYKIEELSKLNLVDGFYLDIKGCELNNKDDIFNIIGVDDLYIDDIKLSIEHIAKYNKGYSQFRTVKYPIVNEKYFKDIQKYVEKYDVEYVINDFMEEV